jgi:hypothetical protein
MHKILTWLATNPLATAVKIGAGAALSWVLENIGSFNFAPATSAVVIAATTVAINALNPADKRYGVGK